MRKTKIVCTIGPASESEKTLTSLIRAGMDVARLNFSHGDYEFHGRMIRTIREIARKLRKPVAILQDLPGPKIRVGAIEGDRVRLQRNKMLTLTTRNVLGTNEVISVDYKNFAKTLRKADPILLGDGEIELEAVKIGEQDVLCRIVVGGILSSHKGIHFPRTSLDLRSLTNRDKKDLAFGIEQKVDMVALSFVRSGDDIVYARGEMKKYGAAIPIIAKIEKHEALERIDGILEKVDGIMVARGDLGLEIAPERIPAMQKMMIRKANHLGKPVITATQMLRSMVQNPRATRAEVADIANAILDGTDALMLSEESATGEYPVEAVRTMAEVAEETERILEPRYHFAGLKKTVPEAISLAAEKEKMEKQWHDHRNEIDGIVELSSIEAGLVRPSARLVELGALLRQICAEVAASHPDAGPQRLLLSVAEAELTAEIDPELLTQALRRLVEHCLEESDGVVTVSLQLDGSGRFQVRVGESALSPEAARRLFEPFGQGENPLVNERGQGNLRLALARALACLLAGRLEVQAGREGRASFLLCLPLRPSSSSDRPAPMRLRCRLQTTVGGFPSQAAIRRRIWRT